MVDLGKHKNWVRKAGILNSPLLEDQIADFLGEYQALAFFSNKVLLGIELLL